MAVTSQRKLLLNETRHFGNHSATFDVPDLTILQTKSYDDFLQADVAPSERKDQGLESVLREAFPIENYEKTARLEYVSYELEKPRYTPDECRRLHLTYGRPFRVNLRLVKTGMGEEGTVEEPVYLGELPIMLGGGEFIINGAERVVVNQLHRSPGVDFLTKEEADRKVYSCRIIPERGSWIEFEITRKESISVRIDQSQKLPVMTLLRAMDEKYGTNQLIIRAFYNTKAVKIAGPESASKIEGKIAVGDVVYPKDSAHAGEVIVESCGLINNAIAEQICTSGVTKVEVMDAQRNKLLLNSLAEDKTKSHTDALQYIFHKLRPGNPIQLDKARDLFHDKFYDPSRYRLGRVGRFRMYRKLHPEIDLDDPKSKADLDATVLRAEDVIDCVRYLNKLWGSEDGATLDDIDHLGNRRLRTIDELASEEIRKGFLKLKRTVQERMRDQERPCQIVNTKNISSAIEFFFGRCELSQVVDQTNPLSMLTHERRLSALGPGGLNRKRAGFEVRDVHSSHYGRICPIETPEGQNIGLISYLSLFASVDEFGFLTSPYRRVKNGVLQDKVDYLRADKEHEMRLAPADTPVDRSGKHKFGVLIPDPTGMVLVRHGGEYERVAPEDVDYIDVAPNQMIGVSAGLIPFLEHDDANRALMGSNMQRQAVPLLMSEAPVVGTGLEDSVAINSSLLVRAKKSGTVTYVDALKIVVDDDVYTLRKFAGLNGCTCENQRPIVQIGQRVEAGDVIADGACTDHGVLALGRNVLVAFMVWDGFNYEDAIILSEELVQKDVYTSIHIEEYETEVRETKLGREQFTRDIPNVSEKARSNLDENGIVRVGTYVSRGDVLVGKTAPKSKTELSPEEKLLHAIFGRAGEDVKDESLQVPAGVEGVVLGTYHFRSSASLSADERRAFDAEKQEITMRGNLGIIEVFAEMITRMSDVLGREIVADDGAPLIEERDAGDLASMAKTFSFPSMCLKNGVDVKSDEYDECRRIHLEFRDELEKAIDKRDRALSEYDCGEQLKRGVLQMAKVYIATKRTISVGDKMAGRHGNKGVIAKILPKEDMPFLADGTPIQIMLNPLGVPSRMNVGQILETHLGWAAATMGYRAITPVFDGATEAVVNDELEKAGLPRNGKVQLYDGRTGEPFAQQTTVGYIYMLKLHHLVDDKVHARSTGPYSLITQQPLGGKARSGGQRYGEMEVWALEAYGAAYTLQELMTVKSDDVEGRTKIYEAMVNSTNTLEAGTPASFDVLVNEVKGLALDMDLVSSRSKDVLPLPDERNPFF
ncbi:MAG: DNA-directed RNA polymerase subunit beta [Thermoguttaceae bacterium]|nr:DNA-directed RNA polymerase subunit beta [Thermoguttaceae bacterium]